MSRSDQPIFFPGLNGIRAIAALAVVALHITVYMDRFGLSPYLIGQMPNGNPKGIDLAVFGVTIFFALSGFLITYLLLAEQALQPISIPNFYIRRILRIWPLYYSYLIVALLVSRVGHVPHESISDLFYFFFAPNVPKSFQLRSDLLGHYWSLGVEEQFYLFWPVFVKAFHRRLFAATAVLLAAFMALKVVGFYVFTGSVFHTAVDVNRFSCMMIGAMGAYLFFHKHEKFIGLATHWGIQLLGWAAVALAAVNRFHIANIINHEVMAGLSTALILGQIRGTGLLNLNTRLMDYLGKISYGIYVIHPLVIFSLGWLLDGYLSPHHALHYVLVYALCTGGTLLVAHLSYQYWEKPFLRLKTRYARVKSAASQEEALQR
jgi:peptidoglycan/LPS O-acetylase OafA/YrhL